YSGWAKASLGLADLALERLAHAKRLSPNDPQSFSLQTCAAFAHFIAGRYQQALSSAEIAARSRRGNLLVDVIGAASAALAGRVDDARKFVARLQATDPSLTIGSVLHLQAMQPADLKRWIEGLRLAGLPEGAGPPS